MILQLMIMHLMLIVFENDDFLFEIVNFLEIGIILAEVEILSTIVIFRIF